MTTRPLQIWSGVYPVRSYDVDARGHLSVATICYFLQDAAGCHAHALGVSIAQLHLRHLTWVLVRMRVELTRHLGWQDRLQIQTWPSHQERLLSHRDFLLLDEAGQDVGRCVTVWVLMDLQRWRPQRLTALPAPLPIVNRPRALSTMPNKLDVPETFVTQRPFQVGDRDLDRNGHVNNVRYIEWALETVPMNVLNTCELEMLEVNFTGEAFHAEHVLAGSQPVDTARPTFLHGIHSQSTGTDLARAKTQWHPTE
jgi:acyl-ACP thioesterase